MESDYNRRASRAETQFSVDTQTLVNKYEETIQNLEGDHQRELRELAERRREEKSQWEFEKDEIAQEVAEAHEQLKASLANEKAVSAALTQEKDLLEKSFKEEVNKLVCEREQLQKELRELRNAAEKREKQLHDKITQLQNEHEKELKKKDEHLSVVEEMGKLVGQRLEQLSSEYKQEKEDLNSKLLALESLNKDLCVRAETEKAEMSVEISNLQAKIQKLQWETHSSSVLQNHYRVLENEYAKAKSKIAAFAGAAPLGDDAGVLFHLQKVHEQAVKENVRLAAEVVRLQHRLGAAGREPRPPPRPGCSSSSSEPAQLPGEVDPVFEGLPSDCREADEGRDLSVLPLSEADTTDLEEVAEIESDKARAGRDLEKTLERAPRPRTLQDAVKEQRVHLLNHRKAAQNKGFSDALKLQAELEKAEELSEASLLLDRTPGSTNGDLESVIARLWERVRELEEKSTAQAELLSLQEGIQGENEDLKSEMIKLVEKNKLLEDNLRKLRSHPCKLEGIKLREENTQGQELEDVQEQDAQSDELGLRCQRGKLEEPAATFTGRQGRHGQSDSPVQELSLERRELPEPPRKPKEKAAALENPTDARFHGEREERDAVTRGLHSTCAELQQKVDLLR